MSNQKNALQAIIERFFELQELKFKEWDEDFIDEDTGEVVTIKRTGLVTDEPSLEEEQLLEQINSQLSEIDTDTLLRMKDEIIWGPMNDYPIRKELNDRGALGFPWDLIQDGVATLPEDMEEIPENYFQYCYFLKSVVFPKNLKRIGKGAFSVCWLTDLRIPDGVTSIGDEAFEYCSLISVHIPDSVTSIGERAFCDCSALKSIIVAEGNPIYDSRENCNAIIMTTTNTLIAGCSQTIIPDSVTSIEDSAFDGCSALTSITIPDSVTSIGEYAFNGCSSLSSITFHGTKEQWQKIDKSEGWNCDSNIKIIRCTDGDVKL